MSTLYEDRSREDLIREILNLHAMIVSLRDHSMDRFQNDQILEEKLRLELFSHLLILAEEGERRRIARELHDETGQTLMAIKINLGAALRSLKDSQILPRLEESFAMIDRAILQVRTLSLDLRPSLLDDFGLIPALRSHAQAMANRLGVEVQFHADPSIERCDPDIETACFRVAQEALNNVAKHANASQIRIEVSRVHSELELVIADNGQGYDVEQAMARAVVGSSLGLLGMRERALLVGGRLTIESHSGQGSEIIARFPFRNDWMNSRIQIQQADSSAAGSGS